jgi:hypothetical protein
MIAISGYADQNLVILFPVNPLVVVMCESMVPNQCMPFAVSKNDGGTSRGLIVDKPISYKSDINMSKDEIVLGFMEISSLPDEPYKYHSSSHKCSKT